MTAKEASAFLARAEALGNEDLRAKVNEALAPGGSVSDQHAALEKARADFAEALLREALHKDFDRGAWEAKVLAFLGPTPGEVAPQ